MVHLYQGFSRLVIFETGRDGTVLACFAGKKTETGRDGTGRKRNQIKKILDGTGQDGGGEFSRRDGTVHYNDLFFHDGTGRCM